MQKKAKDLGLSLTLITASPKSTIGERRPTTETRFLST